MHPVIQRSHLYSYGFHVGSSGACQGELELRDQRGNTIWTGPFTVGAGPQSIFDLCPSMSLSGLYGFITVTAGTLRLNTGRNMTTGAWTVPPTATSGVEYAAGDRIAIGEFPHD